MVRPSGTQAGPLLVGETVEVRYRAIWRRAEYTTAFDPYGLIYYDGDLFTIGRSHRADDVRMLKVTRVLDTQKTDRGFERPADFNLENEFRSSFGILRSGDEPVQITVRFTGASAALVAERVWHESQQLAWLPAEETLFEQPSDQPDTLVARYRLSGVAEFKRWIKGFGDQAEVLKPAWLRVELYAELRDAATAGATTKHTSPTDWTGHGFRARTVLSRVLAAKFMRGGSVRRQPLVDEPESLRAVRL